MSETFVTKFSLFTMTNKVFHISNKEETNISNKADVHYQWGANPLIKKPFLIGTLGNINYYMTCTF